MTYIRDLTVLKFEISSHAKQEVRDVQYAPRMKLMVCALVDFVAWWYWSILPISFKVVFTGTGAIIYWGNHMIAPVPVKQAWRIWVNASGESTTMDNTTTTKQSTTKPCAYSMGYTLWISKKNDHELPRIYWINNSYQYHNILVSLHLITGDTVMIFFMFPSYVSFFVTNDHV